MFSWGLLFIASIVHPFHITYAEAQWNADGSRLQIALRMSPTDLDNALSNVSGRRVLLEQESAEAKRKLVEQYLRDVIYLSATKETRKDAQVIESRHKRFHWIGYEDELRYTWVYFELEAPIGDSSTPTTSDSESEAEDAVAAKKDSTTKQYWLHNRVFFETEHTQINTLQLMKTEPAIAVRTSRQEPVKTIPVVLPRAD